MTFFMNCYVYTHTRLSNNEVFYVGIGIENRAYDFNNRSKFWKRVYNKGPIEVDFVRKDISWEDACSLEIFLIAFYGRRDLKKGLLVNLTDGGDGCLGREVLPKTKEKIRKFQKGRVKSKETRDKLSEAHKGKVIAQSSIDKMKATKANDLNIGWFKRRPVICSVTKKEFKCIKDAASYAKVHKSHLASMLRGDKTNTSTIIYK